MENYRFIEKIGRGTHGSVYLLKSQEGNSRVVCKSMPSKYKTHANNEIDILNKMNHRRVVKIIESMEIKSSVFIILEYANFGSLEKMIEYFSRQTLRPGTGLAWSLLSQLSDALYYMHSKKILHRDIKPANILVNKF